MIDMSKVAIIAAMEEEVNEIKRITKDIKEKNIYELIRRKNSK